MIALVITIVVLLILSAVTWGIISGENGLIGKVKQSKEQQLEAEVKEDIDIKIAAVETDKLGNATLKDLVIKLQEDEKHEYIIRTESRYASLSAIGTINETNIEGMETIEGPIFITRDDVEVRVNKNLVAQLKKEYDLSENVRVLSYNVNVAQMSVPEPSVYREGDTATIDFENVPTREGYTFVGWSTNPGATEEDVEYKEGETTTFTMGNQNVTLYAIWKEESITGIDKTLTAGQEYTIPQGYHDGTGIVRAASLSSQTSASATAADIWSGKTAWVNGTKLTGTKTLASLTSATASASDIASGKTAWVNGTKLTGTNTGMTIGYYNGNYYAYKGNTYTFETGLSKILGAWAGDYMNTSQGNGNKYMSAYICTSTGASNTTSHDSYSPLITVNGGTLTLLCNHTITSYNGFVYVVRH